MSDLGRTLRGGGRFRLTAVEGPPARVAKSGPPGPLAREARALRLVAETGVAPRLVRHEPGLIETELIAGAEVRLSHLSTADAHALGRTLRRVHDARRSATGWLPGWRSRVRTLEAYRRRRAADARSAGADVELAGRVVAALPPLPATPASAEPFALLHGDLVSANILWTPAPRLVDWEFWRMGDPAEDLAYLAEVNAIPDVVLGGVLAGYADRAVAGRLDAWRALCALDAGLWYRHRGAAGEARRLLRRAAGLSGAPGRP